MIEWYMIGECSFNILYMVREEFQGVKHDINCYK